MSETPLDLAAPELPYIQILEDDSVVLAYASKDGGEESMPLPPQVGQILKGVNEFIATQVAEVERLTRIVNGYDRTPAEQRAAKAKAEVDRLRAENAIAWATGHSHPWRRGSDGCTCGAWAKIECGCGRYGNGELLSLADNPYVEPADHDVTDHDSADCPACRYALGLPEPVDATGTARTGPRAANGWPLGQLTISEADDALPERIEDEYDGEFRP